MSSHSELNKKMCSNNPPLEYPTFLRNTSCFFPAPAVFCFLIFQEVFLLVVFSSEYILRMWSAGCRSTYSGLLGRVRFAFKPFVIVGESKLSNHHHLPHHHHYHHHYHYHNYHHHLTITTIMPQPSTSLPSPPLYHNYQRHYLITITIFTTTTNVACTSQLLLPLT